jgi:serine protease
MPSKHAVVPLLFAITVPHAVIPDATASAIGMQAAAMGPQAIVVRYRDDATQTRHARVVATQRLQARAASLGITLASVRQTSLNGEVLRFDDAPDAAQLQATLQALRADPAVLHAEPDVRLFPTALPDDPLYATHQWHFNDPVGGINAPAAWTKSTGAGVVVAVLDTGIVPHADLDANVLAGYDFISDMTTSRRSAPGRAPGALDQGDWNVAGECSGSVRNSSWHGTHVAGTVAQVTHNGIGGAGVAFDARVLPVRVLGKCGGDLSDVADAIVWAAGGSVPDVPANPTPAEVINLSLGGFGQCSDHPMMQAAIDTAVGLGATVVIAAGNAGMDADGFVPASCQNAVVVGATRQSGAIATYSNFGGSIDLAAPGGQGDKLVWQAWHNSKTTPTGSDAYAGMVGTSMAAPHVAGVVALMQSAVSMPLAPDVVERLLLQSTRVFPIKPPSWTPLGVGIVDANAAIDAARREADCLAAPGSCNVPQALIDAVPVPALAGDASQERLFRIDVPHGTQQVRFTTYGGTGNVAIDIKRGLPPTGANADYRADRAGNNETLRIAAPAPGTWFLRIRAPAPYAGVTTQARLD